MKKLLVLSLLAFACCSAFAKRNSSEKENSSAGRKRKVTISLQFDFSASMSPHNARVMEGFEAFAGELEGSQCVDWEVGIGRIDSLNRFGAGGTFPAIYTPDTEPYTKDLKKARSRIGKLATFAEGDGRELLVDALDYLLQNEGEYYSTRDYTAIIVLTDALEYASKADAEDVIAAIQNIGRRKVGVYQFGIDPDLESGDCKLDNQIGDVEGKLVGAGRAHLNEVFQGLDLKPPFSLEKIVKQTGGTFIHMCGKDMKHEMRDLAKTIVKASCQISSRN